MDLRGWGSWQQQNVPFLMFRAVEIEYYQVAENNNHIHTSLIKMMVQRVNRSIRIEFNYFDRKDWVVAEMVYVHAIGENADDKLNFFCENPSVTYRFMYRVE